MLEVCDLKKKKNFVLMMCGGVIKCWWMIDFIDLMRNNFDLY